MGGGDTIIQQQPQASYGESLRESLQAQLDLAGDVYRAEASQNYGRPAYAQLETDILRDTLLGQEAGARRPAGVRDVTSESDRWQTYVELNPDLKRAWDENTFGDQDNFSSMGEWGKSHYSSVGKNEPHRIVPQVGQSYDISTGQVYAPDPNAPDAGTRSGGLLDLLGGAGKQSYGTGGITEEFVTREATPEDVQAGRARYVGAEISDGRIRDGQMIGDTREVLGQENRVAGFDADQNFMGLAQYGSDIAEQSARRQRAADIADVQRFGGIASQAIRESDPISAGLIKTMGAQAEEELAAGGDLTTRERERATQDARMGWEARGRIRDPGAVVSELENLDTARRAREAQRRAFATQTMQASRAMTADPFMAILGRPSGASQQIATQGLGGAQYGLSAAPGTTVNPEAGLSYMLGQQTNQANLQAAQAAANATKSAGMMGGLGALGGGLLGNAKLF